MPLCSRILPFAAALALAGCGAASSSDSPIVVKGAGNVKNAGLAFAVTSSDFVSSALFYYDFDAGTVTAGATGQSGDPLVKWVYDKLYLFNRTKASSGISAFTSRTDPKILSAQVNVIDAGLGDPHDAIRLGDGNLLFSQWAAGKLTVFSPTTNQVVQTIDKTDLDFGGDPAAVFRPETMWSRAVDGGEEVYVAHQGRTADGPLADAQRLFVFKYSGGKLEARDLDAATAGIQGIKINVSNPMHIRADADSKALYIAGICQLGSPAGCKTSGVDKIDLTASTLAATLVVDLSANPLKGNGPIVWGGGDVYYAMMATEVNSDVGTASVVGINAAATDPTLQFIPDVHKFAAGSRGCCGLFADAESGRLYVGDDQEDKTWKLFVYDSPATASKQLLPRIPLAGNPYTGSFVPRPE